MADPSDSGGDSLFAGLQRQEDVRDLALEPIHPRVLEVQEEGLGATLVLCCWRNPGGIRALHTMLRQRVEATLLAELCRPATELRALPASRRIAALRLVLFEAVGTPDELVAATAAFGLRPLGAAETDTSGFRESLAHLRGEAQRIGVKIPDMPAQLMQAHAPTDPARNERTGRIEAALRAEVGDQMFGQRPGALYQAAVKAFAAEELALTPDLEGLDTFELAAGSVEPGVLRWYEPVTFQALCDTVAVVAAKEFGRAVQWAEAELDELGLPTAPLIRAELEDGAVHIPLGAHLMRWCVMPIQSGETVPPLSEWVLDQFGTR